MVEAACHHIWKMVDVQRGFVITEKCYHCGIERNYFTTEDNPPFEEYRDGAHLWNIMGTSQTQRFNLACTICGHEENLKELYGLMMCIGCDKSCEVGLLQAKLEPSRTWVYVAYGFLPIKEHPQLTTKQIEILEQFFNQRIINSGNKIKIVPQNMVPNMNCCYGEVIRDEELLTIEPQS